MAKYLACIVVLLALTITVSSATNWCSITCRDWFSKAVYKHTMCTYRDDRPARKCNKVVKQGLDRSEINVIVNYHNQIRGSVGVPPLVWDNTLATVAQRWANQCDYDHHDKCRNLQSEAAGQNMAYYWLVGSDPQLKDLMTGWVDERRYVNRNIIASFPERTSQVIAHYTQMVWRKTTKIGCGFVKFSERKFLEGRNWDGYTSFLVCNYGKAGNMIGQRVY